MEPDSAAEAPSPTPPTAPSGSSGSGSRSRTTGPASPRRCSTAGFLPVIATTGAEALAIVRADPPDAFLCDHRMAGMDGTEVHDAVAALDPGLARRFAFMSGDVLNPELRDFAAARGVQLLAKPFDIATVA